MLSKKLNFFMFSLLQINIFVFFFKYKDWVRPGCQTQGEYIKLGPAKQHPVELAPTIKRPKIASGLAAAGPISLGSYPRKTQNSFGSCCCWTHQPWLLLRARPIGVGPVKPLGLTLLAAPNVVGFG